MKLQNIVYFFIFQKCDIPLVTRYFFDFWTKTIKVYYSCSLSKYKVNCCNCFWNNCQAPWIPNLIRQSPPKHFLCLKPRQKVQLGSASRIVVSMWSQNVYTLFTTQVVYSWAVKKENVVTFFEVICKLLGLKTFPIYFTNAFQNTSYLNAFRSSAF